MKNTFRFLTMAAMVLFSSCKKDPEETPEPEPETPASTTGSISVDFENVWGADPFVLNTQAYVTANNDTFTANMYKYYISNIVLTNSSGGTYVEPESYHLINAADPASNKFTIGNVPNGTYTGISFMIGVDSLRNVSGAQSGALDPANGMFWSWSTGYIQSKLEGTSPQSTGSGDMVIYHVGGFSGAYNPIKTISPSFGTASAVITPGSTSEIFIKADVSEWFKTPNLININTTSLNMSVNSTSRGFADNYADMFTVDHIEN